jgi:hypothetical protein
VIIWVNCVAKDPDSTETTKAEAATLKKCISKKVRASKSKLGPIKIPAIYIVLDKKSGLPS